MEAGPLVVGLLDGDGLQSHAATRTQEALTGGEELVVAAPIDGLHHLHRDQSVVGAGELAVVGPEHRHQVLEVLLLHQLLGVVALLGRDGGRGDPAPVTPGQMDRHPPTPSLSRRRDRQPRARAWTPGARTWPAAPPRATARGARSRHTNRPWWHRASGRRSRWTGRSERRCGAGRRPTEGGMEPLKGRQRGAGPVSCRLKNSAHTRSPARRIRTRPVRSSVSHQPSR